MSGRVGRSPRSRGRRGARWEPEPKLRCQPPPPPPPGSPHSPSPHVTRPAPAPRAAQSRGSRPGGCAPMMSASANRRRRHTAAPPGVTETLHHGARPSAALRPTPELRDPGPGEPGRAASPVPSPSLSSPLPGPATPRPSRSPSRAPSPREPRFRQLTPRAAVRPVPGPPRSSRPFLCPRPSRPQLSPSTSGAAPSPTVPFYAGAAPSPTVAFCARGRPVPNCPLLRRCVSLHPPSHPLFSNLGVPLSVPLHLRVPLCPPPSLSPSPSPSMLGSPLSSPLSSGPPEWGRGARRLPLELGETCLSCRGRSQPHQGASSSCRSLKIPALFSLSQSWRENNQLHLLDVTLSFSAHLEPLLSLPLSSKVLALVIAYVRVFSDSLNTRSMVTNCSSGRSCRCETGWWCHLLTAVGFSSLGCHGGEESGRILGGRALALFSSTGIVLE
nr:basic proline-rich protein-like [Symphalangus syndactylus]